MRIFRLKYLTLLLFGFISLFTNATINAAQVTQTGTGYMDVQVWGDFVGSNSNEGTVAGFNLFDSSLGTLNAVSIMFESTLTNSVNIENLTSNGGDYTFNSQYGYHLGRLSNGAIGEVGQLVSDSASGFISGGETISVDLTTYVFSESLVFLASDLVLFMGSGLFTIDAHAYHESDLNVDVPPEGAPDYYPNFYGWATLSSSITVIYDYADATAVPEPASIQILALGLIIVGFILRRRVH